MVISYFKLGFQCLQAALMISNLKKSIRIILSEICIDFFIRFARICSHVDDLNSRTKCLTP